MKLFKIPSLPVVSGKVNKDETLKEFYIKDIEKGKVLDGGSFGATFIAKFNGKQVALKQLHARNDEVPKFLKEGKIKSCLMHENIVGLQAVCYKPLMFMMELVGFDFNVFGTDRKLTTLGDLLLYCNSFMFQKNQTIVPSAATDIVKGLKYLYLKEVVHRDLKPFDFNSSLSKFSINGIERNKIFQGKPIICKLCDFGESRSELKQKKLIACTRTNALTRGRLAYMAPELLPGNMLLQSASLSDYKKADIWSLGMTLFCMLHPVLGSPFLIKLSETGFDATET